MGCSRFESDSSRQGYIRMLTSEYFKNLASKYSDKHCPKWYKRTEAGYSKIPLNFKACTSVALGARTDLDPKLIAIASILPHGVICAGGYARSLICGGPAGDDIDLFFKSAEALQQCIDVITSEQNKIESPLYGYSDVDIVTLNKLKYGDGTKELMTIDIKSKYGDPTLQLVKSFYFDSPEHVIDSFDFTVCQFAFDRDNIYFNPISLLDYHQKRLIIHKFNTPKQMLKRITKYSLKGYSLDNASSELLIKYIGDLKDTDEAEILYG